VSTQPNIGPGSGTTTPPAPGTSSTPSGAGQGTGPSTGAGGNTGVVGSTPSHPRSQAPAPPKAKVWNETPAGAKLSGAYEAMRTTFAVSMSSQREQINTLAKRHIGG
jgi:hypothetical protein